MAERSAIAPWRLVIPSRFGLVVLVLALLFVGATAPRAEAQAISGRVTAAATGAPLAGGAVAAWYTSGDFAGYTYADAAGNYTISGLAPGSYLVFTLYNAGYVEELFNNVPCAGSCWLDTAETRVRVYAGATTSGIDFALEAGGAISGRVTDAGTGTGLSNVDVRLANAVTGLTNFVYTDDTGNYTSDMLPQGTYYVRTNDRWTYVDELYNNVACPDDACDPALQGTPVAAIAGATTAGIDFALTRWGTLGGTVTNAATGVPLVNVTVEVYNASNLRMGSSVTNAAGAYSVGHMPTGTYYVVTKGSTAYVDELYANIPCAAATCWQYSTGTGVAVVLGVHTPGIDIALSPAAVISGVVTDSVTGAPLTGVTVVVATLAGQTVTFGQTGVTGQYALGGLPGGTYRVLTSMAGAQGYVDELYNNITCPDMCQSSGLGTAVTATSGVTTSGIDFALAPLGTMSGTVTAAGTGAPLSAVTMRMYNAQGTQVGSAYTNSAGVYSVRLPAGAYYVLALFSAGMVDEL